MNIHDQCPVADPLTSWLSSRATVKDRPFDGKLLSNGNLGFAQPNSGGWMEGLPALLTRHVARLGSTGSPRYSVGADFGQKILGSDWLI